MPPSGGDFLFEESECRSNPGTGEVFCDVHLDTSYQLMTQTVAPAEFYEGQVGTMIEELSGKLGEKIYIKKFSRIEVGT